MATQDKIVEMIFAVKTIYPYYARETDVETLVRTWGIMMRDIPDEVMEAAFYKALQTCKMPPTPADIMEQVKDMQRAFEPSAEEMWAVYYKALTDALRLIPRFSYTYVDESGLSQGQKARQDFDRLWESLPEQIRKYAASPGEFMRTAQQIQNGDAQYEKQRFLKTLPTIERRMEYSTLALDVGRYKMLEA